MHAPATDAQALHRFLRARTGARVSLAELVTAGLDRLPLPAQGQTLARWQLLACVAAHDLSLVKLYEGHTDALAIQAELGAPDVPPGSRWGTWCAEPPMARLHMARDGQDYRLHGAKAWCSGAAQLTHAVVSGWDAQGQPCLARVWLEQPGITRSQEGWQAVGMRETASWDLHFDNVRAMPLGQPGDYTSRPGFWQGGAGIAACWWGGASGIAQMAREALCARDEPHARAHLGQIDVALSQSAALLRECAAWIDEHPRACARPQALRARLACEAAAEAVMRHATRALGAGPLCRHARFAQALADLPVFLRQSHAERDLAALGAEVAQHGQAAGAAIPLHWSL
ncbi:acyl-CoA dehydrogenase [Xenophilus arseniciresistens]|uniref:Acyl-CoA dehydrogenase n=1 Tax=Xenophilus arseniciresistens TaxID=1283306 RepID=A0AAE3N624_9BURK|nr:acyl-CoA dehydrogenase [Xenophilus arseniciresistens]MDA7415031.1 acyl-CoA dehydrogenase [Xenophilus arseniciresistens]